MTSVLEKALAIIAPHACILCGNFNNIACVGCVLNLPTNDVSFCALCGEGSSDWHICMGCTSKTQLRGVIAACEYEGAVKTIIQRYKFTHVRSAYEPLALLLHSALPYFDANWVVTAVPTVSQHVRQRGYDHAHLLAKEFARLRGLQYVPALGRLRDERQIGKTRRQRAAGIAKSFTIKQQSVVFGKRVLVIDDVCTTGATLSEAARALKAAGAAEVWGGVVAWRSPDAKETNELS